MDNKCSEFTTDIKEKDAEIASLEEKLTNDLETLVEDMATQFRMILNAKDIEIAALNEHININEELIAEEMGTKCKITNDENDADLALLKVKVTELEAINITTLQKLEKVYEENDILKEKEITFKSYAKASDTLTEVQSYMRDPSEKGGLGLSTQENNSNTLNKSSDRIVFVSEQQAGSQETYRIG